MTNISPGCLGETLRKAQCVEEAAARPSEEGGGRGQCGAKVAHTEQSFPEFGFQVKVVETCYGAPSSLGTALRGSEQLLVECWWLTPLTTPSKRATVLPLRSEVDLDEVQIGSQLLLERLKIM